MAKKKEVKKIADAKETEAICSTEGYISGVRWLGARELLHEIAWEAGVTLVITEHDKGWLCETVYYKVSGTKQRVEQFNSLLDQYE